MRVWSVADAKFDATAHTRAVSVRVIPSRALVDRLMARNAQVESILHRIFHDRDVESLIPLDRDALLNIAIAPNGGNSGAVPPRRATASASEHDSVKTSSDTENTLDDLEQAPDQDPEVDETQRHFDTNVQRVSDDVNGLSLNVDKQSSYVGASSIPAALKVIFRLAPGARVFLAQSRAIETALPSRAGSPRLDETDAYALPTREEGRVILEAFFTHVHTLMPAVNEQQVWQLWHQKTRWDAPWLALLNTVFVLGSMAAYSAENDDHTIYFARAMHHINIELLGSGDLMVVQALGLLSGYYFHYLSRPNLANNLMGACLRMELALGMHREFSRDAGHAKVTDDEHTKLAEQRRQTWWTIYNLDTWAGFTTGRPTMGRSGPGVTVKPPTFSMESMSAAMYEQALKMLPLILNTSLSKIATRIQDKMAVNHALTHEECQEFDAEIAAWHTDLPSILKLPIQRQTASDTKRTPTSTDSRRKRASLSPLEPVLSPIVKGDVDYESVGDPNAPSRPTDRCPVFLQTSRIVMHYRYQNLRILIARPAVLSAALRRMPFSSISPHEKTTISRCRAIAAQTIHDISTMTKEEHIVGWTGTWFMYNAVMVPLVSLFHSLSLTAANTRHDQMSAGNSQQEPPLRTPPVNDPEADEWRAQIEKAIKFLKRMIPWCSTAEKSHDVVRRLYEASEHFSEYNRIQGEQLASHAPSGRHSPSTKAYDRRDHQFDKPQQQQQQQAARGAFTSEIPTSQIQQPHGGFVTSLPLSESNFQQTTPNYVGQREANAGHPSHAGYENSTFQSQFVNDHNFWNMQPLAEDVSFDIEQFWQEMQWESVPTYGGMDFSDYNDVNFLH
ncbi:Fungal specific transcription factor domain-containing protein 28 [Elsinoe fawcettii]|nr:Fungal specific transcription factor domain-containing protein 28 [Elsinoe fawcettii]